ncbi:hypothetical protein BSZ19_03730 [Bradyrhizobium japonicum]|uniref:Peptidase C14 caspase domain-containing protein n=1 Tax=Bradyrhizobium japonicum TaxID=375 RepID=A0A1Y2JWU3_BRAJP|nr:caspase family protein [Bradyrhizobium japonicum]OSJ36549.1 hypothetical protein BSZ19_03730 [Bradyrhizobium japonicum]
MPLADRALVVGIDRYPAISALFGAENDAKAFHTWVTSSGQVDGRNTLLLTSSAFTAATNADEERPAKELIERFFTDIDNAAEANNQAGLGHQAGRRLWMFFSGHGFSPSLDKSAVLMANASLKRVHSVASMLWANRFYEGGWFDEVILFQDACRTRIDDVELAPPFLRIKQASLGQIRRRFYAFSAKDRLISKEKMFENDMRGVFSATLMQGLKGDARDPKTGAITTAQLKLFLQDNMKKSLSPAELDDDEIAKIPEVYDPDPFDILAAPAGWNAAPTFPLAIAVGNPGGRIWIEGAAFATVASVNEAPPVWSLTLPRGFYRVRYGGAEVTFEVTGALKADGSPAIEDVSI